MVVRCGGEFLCCGSWGRGRGEVRHGRISRASLMEDVDFIDGRFNFLAEERDG